MAFYRECPVCGANLDPGETCTDCREREMRHEDVLKMVSRDKKSGQMFMNFEEMNREKAVGF